MFGKRWVKVVAVVAGIVLLLAAALPFAADALLTRWLHAGGAEWSSVARNGLEWRFDTFALGPLTAAEARMQLGTKPSFALRRARIDLAPLLERDVSALGVPPAWLYVSADPLELAWGEYVLASGMRGRLQDGRVVASGPTLSVRGGVADSLRLDFDGEVRLGATQLAGQLSTRRTDTLSVELKSAKLRVAGPAVGPEPAEIADIAATLSGRIGKLEGPMSAFGADGRAAIDCVSLEAAQCALSVVLDAVEASALVQQLAELSPLLASVRASGRAGGRAQLELGAPRAAIDMTIDALSASRTGIRPERYAGGEFVHYVSSASGKRVEVRSGEDSESWVPADEVASVVLQAIRAALDPGFDAHPGYDAKRVAKVLEALYAGAELERYPGTIAQGLAMRLERRALQPSVAGQLVSLLQAAELTRALGRDRVLELYVNVAEWGPDVHGIGAAAQLYFEKRPRDLNAREAAFLALLLADPFTLHDRWYRSARPDRERIDALLRQMQGSGRLGDIEMEEALQAVFWWER